MAPFGFCALALALALSFCSSGFAYPRQVQSSVTSTQLLSIAPKSSTCDGAPYPTECRSADQAAYFINSAFNTYGTTSPGEMAALIGIMAFESGDFKYNINYYPGNPGQGTRNMQSAAMNLLYAKSIPALTTSLAALTGGPNAVRSLLTANDAYDFGSAAWFLTTQCSPSIKSGLQSGGLAGWQTYISSCVGTTPTEDRQTYWQRAMQVLGSSV